MIGRGRRVLHYDVGGVLTQRRRWADFFRREAGLAAALAHLAVILAPAWLYWTGAASAVLGGRAGFLLWLAVHVVTLREAFALMVLWTVASAPVVVPVVIALTDDVGTGTLAATVTSAALYAVLTPNLTQKP